TVKSAERSGAPLEILTTPQWFVKTIEHKEMLMRRTQELDWHPKTMKIKLENWINSIAWDWCISRQRYFGVPFPVWYSKRAGEEGKPIFASLDQLPVDPMVDLPRGYSKEEVQPDLDVMDTWATSAVSPQLSSKGIAKGFMVDETRHKKLFPMDLRPQAHEILRTWGFYTILKADLHEDTLPWQNIMISGWCLAEDKSKMSKSKGNVVVPEKILEQYGADVIRYWSASSKLGADTAYSENVISNGKRLVNKLWNAAKFASQHFDKLTLEEKNLNLEQLTDKISADFDKYFLSRLQDLIFNVTKEFEKYEYASAMHLVERFFWDEFCDNYLEISKTRAYDENNKDPQGSQSSRITLYHSVKILLQLFAPFLPHITEELYQILYAKKDDNESIHDKGNWPNITKLKLVDIKEGSAKDLLIILELVRKIKAYDNLSIKAGVEYIEVESKVSGLANSESLLNDLKNVTASKEIRFVSKLTDNKQQLTEDNLSINVVYSKTSVT
ncbi:MAG: class I tRNA ligase family protein, partial [Rickettsiaceae bacterium]|nr:class I tRNA ligase family protein [Rickettsiaceae bacterium]